MWVKTVEHEKSTMVVNPAIYFAFTPHFLTTVVN